LFLSDIFDRKNLTASVFGTFIGWRFIVNVSSADLVMWEDELENFSVHRVPDHGDSSNSSFQVFTKSYFFNIKNRLVFKGSFIHTYTKLCEWNCKWSWKKILFFHLCDGKFFQLRIYMFAVPICCILSKIIDVKKTKNDSTKRCIDPLSSSCQFIL